LAGDDSTPAGAEKLVIGLCRSPQWPLASPAMIDAFGSFSAKLTAAGHTVIERDLPAPFAHLAAAQTLIHRRELAMVLGHIRRDHPAQISPAFAAMIDQGAAEADSDYEAALALQRACKAIAADVFAGLDMLLVPGAPGPAPKGLFATGDPAFQRIWTAIGAPCLGFPAAWDDDGLPLGLQIIAAPHSDRQLLANAPAILTHSALREF
jgi:amidase